MSKDKTAMQELSKWLDKEFDKHGHFLYSDIRKKTKKLLEVEREQLIEFGAELFKQGRIECISKHQQKHRATVLFNEKYGTDGE